MKKQLVLFIVCALTAAACLVLAGCSSGSDEAAGGTDAGDAAAPVEEPAQEAEANLLPDEVYPGHVVGDTERTSDIWWKDGEQGTEGIYFTNAANDAGLAISWVDAAGKDVDTQFDCEISPEGHFVSMEGVEPACDIVFDDALTCYDYASETWYIRGFADELMASLAGLTFADEDGAWTVMLYEDGTFTDVLSNGDEATGTWEFISSCNIRLTYDDSGIDPEELDVEGEGGQVVALSNTWNYLAVQ